MNRCIDGRLFGALPRCPTCLEGRLRVKYESKWLHGGSGSFSCPGTRSDVGFNPCSYKSEAVSRAAWKFDGASTLLAGSAAGFSGVGASGGNDVAPGGSSAAGPEVGTKKRLRNPLAAKLKRKRTLSLEGG
eukprot:SAG11_NODE_8751_length_980_cov_1.085131_1_plen_130_part_10